MKNKAALLLSRLALLGAAALLGLSTCARKEYDLPDFPGYPPGEEFLERYRRYEKYQPLPPPVDHFSEEDRRVLEELERQKRLYQAQLEYRARERERTQGRGPFDERFERYRQRVERLRRMEEARQRTLQASVEAQRRQQAEDFQALNKILERNAAAREFPQNKGASGN